MSGHHILDKMNIPKDISYGECLITMAGSREIKIENYRCICSFDERLIRIMLKKQRLCIFGEKLEIPYYFADEIRICGRITRIEFETERGSV